MHRPKFDIGEKVLYLGKEVTVTAHKMGGYIIDQEFFVYESDLVSAETTERDWDQDGGSS